MIPSSVVQQTIARYQERTSQRTANEQQLRSGSPMTADSRQRVEKRLVRLAVRQAERAILTSAAEAAASAVTSPPSSLLERVIGQSDLMSVTFLESAVAAARTVARLRIRSGGRTVGYGTGSLIAPRLLLTNNHVFDSPAAARGSLAEFNYQDGIQSPTVFALDPDAFFLTDPTLDYTIVAVSERSENHDDLEAFGFNRLIEEEGKVLIGECLNIVQHPNGEVKQVAIRENQLKDVLDLFLHYHTDTAPGSSGSPVFNDQWEVVGLHHSGVPRTNEAGQYLSRDGRVWTPDMGEHRVDWIANEGARISRILAHLKNQSLNATARALRDSVFDPKESQPVPAPPVSAPLSSATAGVKVGPDGMVTWTIPVEISVRVGSSPTAAPVASVAPPVISAPPAPPPAAPQASDDLQSALDAVEEGRRRPYYEAEKDASDRETYYAGIDPEASGSALFSALADLLKRTHSPRPGYKPAVHVYPFVDLHPNGKLRSVYSQKEFTPEELIHEDFRIEQERSRQMQETLRSESLVTSERFAAELDLLEAQLPFNCEHVVPQSWFSKREPMRGDLHHLFACEPGCNSFRGNIPFFDFADFEEVIRGECGKRESNRFEPGAAKGIVARATLYFLLRYPGAVNGNATNYDAARLAMLVAWHGEHPVTEYEQHRNMAIFEKQGNRNPLIDDPRMADRIDFSRGL